MSVFSWIFAAVFLVCLGILSWAIWKLNRIAEEFNGGDEEDPYILG